MNVELGEPVDRSLYQAVPGVWRLYHPRVDGEADLWSVVEIMLEDGFHDETIFVVYFDDQLLGATHEIDGVTGIITAAFEEAAPC